MPIEKDFLCQSNISDLKWSGAPSGTSLRKTGNPLDAWWNRMIIRRTALGSALLSFRIVILGCLAEKE
jgi:hypothetical protein